MEMNHRQPTNLCYIPGGEVLGAACNQIGHNLSCSQPKPLDFINSNGGSHARAHASRQVCNCILGIPIFRVCSCLLCQNGLLSFVKVCRDADSEPLQNICQEVQQHVLSKLGNLVAVCLPDCHEVLCILICSCL